MMYVILENLINIAGAAVIMLIGIFGSWLSLELGEHIKFKNINAAQQLVVSMSQQTVSELQQTVVNQLKAAHADGKLSKEEIVNLSRELISRTIAKLAKPTQDLLKAVEVDIIALIQGAGEARIEDLKRA